MFCYTFLVLDVRTRIGKQCGGFMLIEPDIAENEK